MLQKFHSDHDNPKDSQLIVCLTGTPEYIREQLEHLAGFKKPQQGTFLSAGNYSTIITPIWRGDKY